jgi:hypothetical protein
VPGANDDGVVFRWHLDDSSRVPVRSYSNQITLVTVNRRGRQESS